MALFFCASGVAKLLRPTRAAQASGHLGVAFPLQVPSVALLSLVELGVAAMLLRSGAFPVLSAAILLCGLTIWLLMLRSRAPHASCGCLGELGTGNQAVGVARNFILLVLLGAAASQPSAPQPIALLVGVEFFLTVTLTTEGVSLLHHMRGRRLVRESQTSGQIGGM